MHHHIYTSGKPERRRAGGGIPKNSQFFARLRWGEVILTVDDAPVFQRDGLAVLQTLEQRARFHSIGLQRGGVQRAGLVMLLNAIAVAFHRMVKRVSAHQVISVIEHQTLADL